MKKFDIAIIGAGASGMMAAIAASSSSKRVALIDKNPQLGRKLLATGNGRCNLTNRHLSIDRYHGGDLSLIEGVLQRFDQNATMRFFESIGLLLKEEGSGRIFPRTNQASSVVQVLSQTLNRNGVELILESALERIEIPDSWKIVLSNGKSVRSDKLIIATGGRAAHHLGSTGDGLYWAKKLGHTLTWVHAALVPIETVEPWVKQLQGIKVEAGVRATNGDKTTAESTGDLLFTSYGVSGPSVMAQARDVAVMLRQSEVKIHIDMFPDMSEGELNDSILHIFNVDSNRSLSDALVGILPSGIISVIVKLAELSSPMKVSSISSAQLSEIVNHLKDLTLTASKLRPFKEAQVTAGGIRSDEIDSQTLESKLVPGLYFAGEILDADGDSGGFNLQWAWSSGYVAGLSAAK